MTALTKYQKLECTGLWRDAPEAQRREVVVNFGEASLTMSDPRSELALSHWSLPAVERMNPGEMPALYAPGPEADETLELDDPDMIAALETVHEALVSALPRPGRLRNSVLGGLTVLVLGLGIFWMPGALVTHTASVVPPATRAEIGRMALADMIRLTGLPCSEPLGARAAERLTARIFGPEAAPLLILPDGVSPSAHLPDGRILLSQSLLERQDGPEAVAGFALEEAARIDEVDPLIPLLQHAGTAATFRLLTTGALPEDAVEGYAEHMLRDTPEPPAEDLLLARFEAAQISSTPFAFARDPSGESVLGLIEADPFRGASPSPVLTDGDWVSLQGICLD